MNRQFLDGSIGHDLPMNKLSIFFNVNNFIVSQTNPWYLLFDLGSFHLWTTQKNLRLLIIQS